MTHVLTRFTRRIHAAAVRLHLVGLRAAVSEAARRSDAAWGQHSYATAVVSKARDEQSRAFHQARQAAAQHEAVEEAARTEATTIGGKL